MRVTVADDVVIREMADEAILLNLATGTYFGLDAVGVRCWQLLAEHGSTERTVPHLLAEFDVDEGQLRQDLDALVARLIAARLLLAADAPAAR